MHPLAQARKRLALTQRMLADFAQVSLPTIQRAEVGKPLRADMIQLICDYFSSRYSRPVKPQDLGLLCEEEPIGAPSAPEEEPGSQERGTQPTPQEDWGEAPHVEQFYGREEELLDLHHWVVNDHCRVVAILGIGGIGKTSLAISVASRVKAAFACIFWRSLHNALSMKSLLRDYIQFVSRQQQTDLPQDVEDQISLLLQYLQERRCLLVLDNVETVLEGGTGTGCYREGYEGYGRLFQRIGETRHHSCLLLTSREKPQEIAFLEGETSPVRSYHLIGLRPNDGREILIHKGIHGEEKDWEVLVTHYGGNPLALKLVSQSIRELFDGNIAPFLTEGDPLVSDISAVLDQQFERLTSLEQRIMYWLAIEREAISLKKLQEDLVHLPTMRTLQEALASLRRRDLIEAATGTFALQQVVLEYVTERCIDRVYDEIATGPMLLLESHALLKAQTKDYVRESQVRLILAPVAQRLLAVFGREALETRLKGLLATLRKRHPQQPGYMAGNILNLLIHLQYDLHGYDFSHLAIWQAWLPEANLPHVNFSQASFASCAFKETFGDVLSVAFHPAGEVIATGTANNEIRVWQAGSGIPLLICQGHTDWVYAVAFSPDGTLLASGSYDRTVRLWDARTGQALACLQGHTNGVRSVSFSPDGKLLASSGDDQSIRVWDGHTGQALRALEGQRGWVRSVAFSPDGKLLASGNDDQTICLWNVESGACVKTLLGHEGWVRSVAFSPDGKLLASGGGDRSIRLWDVEHGETLEILRGHNSAAWSVAFSLDGKLLTSSSDDQSIRLWDVNRREVVRVLQGHSGSVRSLAFSPDGNTLISGGSDQSVRLWDVNTGQLLKTLLGHSSVIWSIAVNPHEDMLASSGGERSVHLWSLGTGQLLKTLRGHSSGVWSVAFSPGGRLLASSGDDQSIRLWDVATNRIMKTLYGHGGGVRAVTFSPNGELLASGSDDRSVRLWDVTSGLPIKTLVGHRRWVRSVAFSPDGTLLATGSGDQSIGLWDVGTGQLLNVFQDHSSWVRSVAFHPDGKLLASGCGDHKIRLWDVDTGQLLNMLQVSNSGIRSVAFSPDGKLLAAGYQDTTMRVWDLHSGQVLMFLQGHVSGGIWSVCFSADGSFLLSGGDDGTIRFWDVETGTCVKTVRSDKPYEGMNITGALGLTEAQKAAIIALGACEER